jgi:hypothetical protein
MTSSINCESKAPLNKFIETGDKSKNISLKQLTPQELHALSQVSRIFRRKVNELYLIPALGRNPELNTLEQYRIEAIRIGLPVEIATAVDFHSGHALAAIRGRSPNEYLGLSSRQAHLLATRGDLERKDVERRNSAEFMALEWRGDFSGSDVEGLNTGEVLCLILRRDLLRDDVKGLTSYQLIALKNVREASRDDVEKLNEVQCIALGENVSKADLEGINLSQAIILSTRRDLSKADLKRLPIHQIYALKEVKELSVSDAEKLTPIEAIAFAKRHGFPHYFPLEHFKGLSKKRLFVLAFKQEFGTKKIESLNDDEIKKLCYEIIFEEKLINPVMNAFANYAIGKAPYLKDPILELYIDKFISYFLSLQYGHSLS